MDTITDTYLSHDFYHQSFHNDCSSCFSERREREKERMKNWPTVAEANAMKFPQNNASNIPCGYDSEGLPSNNCYC